MRVCPKCKYLDPPHWKHTKYSYYIDACTFENFKDLHPDLAFQLRKGGAIVEDEDYCYRLTKHKRWVERKAKADFIGAGWSDKTEKHAQLQKMKDWHADHKDWLKWHPDQSKLSEWNGKLK